MMSRVTIPPHRDAFGHQVWAYFKDHRSPAEIVERDDGFVSFSENTAWYFGDVRRWSASERRAIRLARGHRALDVGCGAGRVALHLQERGFDVTAIDNSPLVVKTARARGVRDARLLPFENITQFERDTFDTVVMFGNNFGLFGSRARATRIRRTSPRISHISAVITVAGGCLDRSVSGSASTNSWGRGSTTCSCRRRRCRRLSMAQDGTWTASSRKTAHVTSL